MNYAVIFAGGTGKRMKGCLLPKQLLKVHGKEIIIHTVEKFQNCPEIDGIVIVCYEPTIKYIKELIKNFALTKVLSVIPGGETGQESIFKGIEQVNKISRDESDIVLIHDGVRPLINKKLIIDNIQIAKEHGNCITVCTATETVVTTENETQLTIIDRSLCFNAKAPQTFLLKDIYAAHKKAQEITKNDFIDSATLMKHFGHDLNIVKCGPENIKITTQMDFYMFKAILDANEILQVETYEVSE